MTFEIFSQIFCIALAALFIGDASNKFSEKKYFSFGYTITFGLYLFLYVVSYLFGRKDTT